MHFGLDGDRRRDAGGPGQSRTAQDRRSQDQIGVMMCPGGVVAGPHGFEGSQDLLNGDPIHARDPCTKQRRAFPLRRSDVEPIEEGVGGDREGEVEAGCLDHTIRSHAPVHVHRRVTVVKPGQPRHESHEIGLGSHGVRLSGETIPAGSPGRVCGGSPATRVGRLSVSAQLRDLRSAGFGNGCRHRRRQGSRQEDGEFPSRRDI